MKRKHGGGNGGGYTQGKEQNEVRACERDSGPVAFRTQSDGPELLRVDLNTQKRVHTDIYSRVNERW